MGFNTVGTNERQCPGAHGAEVLCGACTNSSPGHLAQLAANQLKGDAFGFGELDCNVRCMGDDDAVIAGLEAEVFGADGSARISIVEPASRTMEPASESRSIWYALVAMRRFRVFYALSGEMEDSREVDCSMVTAPPWTRRSLPASSSAARSRRTVSIGHIVTARKVSAVDCLSGGNKLCQFRHGVLLRT